MLSVAVLDDYQGVALTSADWTVLKDKVSITVFRDTLHDEHELVSRLHHFDIISTMRERTRFSKSLLTQLPRLRLLTTTGMGNRSIDLKAALDMNIVVSGTTATASSTIEHIWALILATARYIALEDAYVKSAEEQWQHTIPIGLSGKTLGLVGLGRLGQATAKIAKAFNMTVIAWSPHLTKERAEEAGVEFASTKKALLETADIVSIHMVLSETTRHLITVSDLSAMKPSAIIINTSRGPIIEEEGLIKVLEDGIITAAGLDVFDIEPLPLNHPFRKLPNVTLSPHLGYVCDDSYKSWWQQTVENIDAFLKGSPIRLLKQ